MADTEYPIQIQQLAVGLFVRLDIEADKNPFRKNAFKIKTEKQIRAIQGLGLEHVVCVLEKSDRMPLPPRERAGDRAGGRGGAGETAGQPAAEAPDAHQGKTPVSVQLLGLKRETIERNKGRRQRFRKVERTYDTAMSSVVTILRRASGRSSEAAEEASQLVDSLVQTFLSERDTMINLMSSKPSEEAKNYHALNVTVLSMMVGKALKLKSEVMHALGLGALFHDIGKGRVPMQAVDKVSSTSMNKAAAKYYKEHPIIGARLVADFSRFPALATRVVLEHHESLDGSGYPKGLSGDAISPLSRVVAVVNAYDTLINERQAGKSLTPHLALKRLYAGMRAKLDPRILAVFIRNMGVFPPGTVVKLSNGQYGMVTTLNPANPTRPSVLMYHPEIPKNEALLVDMDREEDLQITETLRPEELPREVFSYLSPSRNIAYYAEAMLGA
ncbi:HD-GYP domain-containing protein [Desulfocurvus sp. DL9XJH121]